MEPELIFPKTSNWVGVGRHREDSGVLSGNFFVVPSEERSIEYLNSILKIPEMSN